MIIYCLIRWPAGKVSEYFNLLSKSEYLQLFVKSLFLIRVDYSSYSHKVAKMRVGLDLKAEDVFWLSVSPTLFIRCKNRLEV